MAESEVTIRLTVTEAMVLHALLKRYSQTDKLTVEDQAEQRALWNLECLFEREVSPMWPTLEESRESLRDPVEE
jgi:hypothetical protein